MALPSEPKTQRMETRWEENDRHGSADHEGTLDLEPRLVRVAPMGPKPDPSAIQGDLEAKLSELLGLVRYHRGSSLDVLVGY